MTASRQRAEALILAAKVLVDGVPVTKAGKLVSAASALEIVAPDHPYVSRGGVKLEHALAAFSVPVAAQVAMDVGASTGGFTDCLLQFGARRVYAVDVGYGQLAWKLRRDPRVVAIERQNIRSLNRSQVPEAIQLATVDVSFISLKLAIPPMIAFLAPGAYLVALIKPQFEAGRENVGKGGVVRDPGTQERVCDDLLHWSRSCGLAPLGITPSPLLGPKGNREFLLAARVTS
jgi:23S rRNA (cytidine1920-2'-O)/16S rRNA (cytidine1409-2'-O)-methyltransferase